MKTLAVFLTCLGLAVVGYAGQTNQVGLKRSDGAPAPEGRQTETLVTRPRTNAVQRSFHVEKTYGGALTDLRKQKRQFFRAPPGEGKPEFSNVSINPHNGRAEGIVLFSIGF